MDGCKACAPRAENIIVSCRSAVEPRRPGRLVRAGERSSPSFFIIPDENVADEDCRALPGWAGGGTRPYVRCGMGLVLHVAGLRKAYNCRVIFQSTPAERAQFEREHGQFDFVMGRFGVKKLER